MINTAFGDLEWNEPQGLWQWLQAHDIKHQALSGALVQVAKVPTPVFLLADNIDDKWVLDHANVHNVLANQFAPSTSTYIVELLTNPMVDEDTFYQWLDIHDQIHEALDQSLGISGS